MNMVLEGKGKITEPGGTRTIIYVPRDVAKDSTFPFKPGEDVTVRIDGKRIVVEKRREG